jgi:hypothetical protein
VNRREVDGTRPFWDQGDLIASATTDLSGRADIAADACQPAVLYVHADGFIPGARRLLSLSNLTIRLDRGKPSTEEYVVLDRFTRQPVLGAQLFGREGPVSTSSEADGRVKLDRALDTSTTVQLRGDGIASMYFQLDQCSENEILAVPSSQIEIRLRTNDALYEEQPTVLLFRVPDRAGFAASPESVDEQVSSSMGEVLVPQSAEWQGEGKWRAVIPARTPIQIYALLGDSGEASAIVTAEPGQDVVELSIEHGEPLLVQPPDDPKGIVGTALVEYWNRSRIALKQSPKTGAFHIARPADVRQVIIRVDGFAPIQIRPSPGGVEDQAAGGWVTPNWVPAHRGHFVVKDAEGNPVGGAGLRFSWSRSHSREYPALSGFAPTDHAGWVSRVDPAIEGLTGADGELVLSLPSGGYTVFVDPAEGLSLANRGGSAYRLAFAFDIQGDARFDWVIPNLRLVSVKAFSATGLPSKGFEVSAPEGLPGISSKSNGSFWQGWIPASARQLTIRSSSGADGAEVALAASLEPQLDLEVTLGSVQGAIILTGEGILWDGARAKVRATAGRSSGAPMLLDRIYDIGEGGWIPFDVPGQSQASIQVSVVLPGGKELSTSPLFQQWCPSSVLRFSVNSP